MLRNGCTVLRVLLLLALVSACSSDPSSPDGDMDSDVAASSDADSDADSDGDIDSPGDAGWDGDEEEECYDTVDVVFVIDVSISMSVLLRALESQISLVWNAALEHDSEPHFGLVVFVDDVFVANGGEPYASIDELRTDFGEWAEHAATNEQTQSSADNTDWPENTLDALVAAATDYGWRPMESTVRLIIHATDDTFLEHPYSFSSAIQVQHTYAEAIEALQSREIRIATFAARMGGAYEDDDVQPGFFTDYDDMPSIPEATSGRAFDIDEVGQSISLADSINEFVAEELCEEYILE